MSAQGWITVRVPASTSNLGSGFDCVGVAVDRWLTVRAALSADPPRRSRSTARELLPDRTGGAPETRSAGAGGRIRPRRLGARSFIERRGALTGLALEAGEDFIEVGLAAACQVSGRELPEEDLLLEADSDIPVARGLGSSAAAVVAGAALANVLFQLGLDRPDLVEISARVEGHPDNVAPAVCGGAVLALRGAAGDLILAHLEVHESVAFVFAVPDFSVETRGARAALPQFLPHASAARAAARSAALVCGLAQGEGALLAAALEDELHVPYRRPLVRGFDEVRRAAERAGAFGATLSGSGSALVALAPRERAGGVAAAMRSAWREVGVEAESFESAGRVEGFEILMSPETVPAAGPEPPSA